MQQNILKSIDNSKDIENHRIGLANIFMLGLGAQIQVEPRTTLLEQPRSHETTQNDEKTKQKAKRRESSSGSNPY